MIQEHVSQKILAELIELKVISEKDEDVVWKYLQLAWGAGFDEGRMQNTKRKPIGQYTPEGKLIKIWLSCVLAARYYQVDKSSISKAALGKNETCAGYRWRYINLTKPASEAKSIKLQKLKTIRPIRKNRVSRTDQI